MKIHRLSKFVGISLLSLSIGILPIMLPASAQTNTDPGTNVAGKSGDHGFDWGWLGLLGLAGLAGLKGGKKQEANTAQSRESERQRDSHEGNSSGYRDPDSVHPSSYTDSDAVGRSYADPDVRNRPERR